MNITLKKDSWHFKIYSKVYSDNRPKSLCPYFWRWVAIILVSPILILIWVMKFLTNLFESKPKPKKSIDEMTEQELREETDKLKKKEKRGELGAKIFLGFWGLVSLGLLILGMVVGIQKDGWYSFFKDIFSLIGLLFTLYLVIRLIADNVEKIGNSNVVKVPLAMIKAIYTKTCPIINWK